MQEITATMAASETNHAITQAYDPNNPNHLAAMGNIARNLLRQHFPADGVNTVDVDIASPGRYKFKVTSTNILNGNQVKAALRRPAGG